MSFDYSLLPEEDLIFGYGSGNVTAAEIAEDLARISSLPQFHHGMDRYVIFDDTTSFSDLNLEGMKRIQETSWQNETGSLGHNAGDEKISYKLAIVCSSALTDVVFSMYQGLWKSASYSNVEVRTFTDRQEGLDWIERPNMKIPDIGA